LLCTNKRLTVFIIRAYLCWMPEARCTLFYVWMRRWISSSVTRWWLAKAKLFVLADSAIQNSDIGIWKSGNLFLLLLLVSTFGSESRRSDMALKDPGNFYWVTSTNPARWLKKRERTSFLQSDILFSLSFTPCVGVCDCCHSGERFVSGESGFGAWLAPMYIDLAQHAFAFKASKKGRRRQGKKPTTIHTQLVLKNYFFSVLPLFIRAQSRSRDNLFSRSGQWRIHDSIYDIRYLHRTSYMG